MDTLGYLAMLLVGVSLGLIGGGGSILTVPILVYLFAEPPMTATGYSLFIVGVSSILGTIHYQRSKLVDYRTAIFFAPPAFFGTFLARQIVLPRLPEVIISFANETMVNKEQLIMGVFAIIMLSASVAMIRPSKSQASEAPTSTKKPGLLALLGVCVGFVTGFVGVGGGFLIIPSLVIFAHLPMTKAVGTSLFLIAANSLFGFAGDVLAGHPINWSFLLVTTAIASAGTIVGSYSARFASPSKLKAAFGWLVLIMGAFVLISQFGR